MHGLECGSGGDEVIENDDVGLIGEPIEREDSVYPVTIMAKSNVFIERDFQEVVNFYANKGGEVMLLMAAFWGCADAPVSG